VLPDDVDHLIERAPGVGCGLNWAVPHVLACSLATTFGVRAASPCDSLERRSSIAPPVYQAPVTGAHYPGAFSLSARAAATLADSGISCSLAVISLRANKSRSRDRTKSGRVPESSVGSGEKHGAHR